MPQMLLILEPLGQRAERGRAAGEAVYQRMLDFAAELQAEGLLLGVNSLGTAARRLSKREGGAQVLDGPFAEAKEMIGGYFLLDTEDPAVALPVLLDHVRAGRLDLASQLGPSYPLDRINEAIDASLAGVPGRVLVLP